MRNREFRKMVVAAMVGTMTMSMAVGCTNQSDSKSAKADETNVKQEHSDKKSIDLDTEDNTEQSAKGIGSYDLGLNDLVSDDQNTDDQTEEKGTDNKVEYTIALDQNKEATDKNGTAEKKSSGQDSSGSAVAVKKHTTVKADSKKEETKKNETVKPTNTVKRDDAKPIP